MILNVGAGARGINPSKAAELALLGLEEVDKQLWSSSSISSSNAAPPDPIIFRFGLIEDKLVDLFEKHFECRSNTWTPTVIFR